MSNSCSCIICKKLTTLKGLHSHILSAHTKEGKEMRRKCGALSKRNSKLTIQKLKEQRIIEYNENPTHCIFCDTKFDYSNRNKKFCNSSCAASFNNKNRSITQRKKQAKSLLKSLHKKETLQKYSKISFCVICGSLIKKKHIKTCSKICYSKLLSNKAKDNISRLKYNRGRHKKSYLELSFEEWLITNNVKDFIMEYKVKYPIENKTFFIDFYFPKLNLGIELDGSQHLKTIEYDNWRDNIIFNLINCKILRISHLEYKLKSKLHVVKELLNIGAA